MNKLTFRTLRANSADVKMMIFFLISQKKGCDISCKLFSEKNISKSCLLKILPVMQSINHWCLIIVFPRKWNIRA